MPRPTLPLRLTHHGDDVPVLLFNGVDITRFVAADGLTIDYSHDKSEINGRSMPVVTIKFGYGALDLDLDLELLERLTAAAKTKAADR